jgi:hypothetical protein
MNVSEEYVASGLAQAAATAISEGRAVSIRIDGEPKWEAIDHVNHGPCGPAIVEVRRARDGHVLFIPAGRIIALDVGEAHNRRMT